MSPFKKISVFVMMVIFISSAKAQYIAEIKPSTSNNDSLDESRGRNTSAGKRSFPIKPMIIPATMMTYGLLSINSNGLKKVNKELQEELWNEHPHNLLYAENYLVFAPAAAAFTLQVFGVKGKSNFRDKTIIYLLSNIFANTLIYPAKKIAHQLRPDNSNYYSFPSGHTALAFSSAEFLRMEYKNVSAWYGIAGYTMAATTGFLRMYNNKHWFSDVVMGAGVGIASTKLAYWLYPKIQHWFLKNKSAKTVIMPGYNNGNWSVGLVHPF